MSWRRAAGFASSPSTRWRTASSRKLSPDVSIHVPVQRSFRSVSAVRNRTSVKNQGNRFCRLRRKSNEIHAPAARNCGFAKSWGRPQDKTGFFYGVRAKIRAKKAGNPGRPQAKPFALFRRRRAETMRESAAAHAGHLRVIVTTPKFRFAARTHDKKTKSNSRQQPA